MRRRHDHQRRTQISYDESTPASRGRRPDSARSGLPRRRAGRHDAAQRFRAVRGGCGAAAALGSPVVPINWHLKAEEVALHPGRQRRRISWSAMPICCRRSATACRRMYCLLVVATPPEIAAAFGDRAGADRDPEGTDRLGPLARQPSASRRSRRGAPQRCSIPRAPRACRRACAASRCSPNRRPPPNASARSPMASSRGEDQVDPDERPDVSLGAAFLRHAGVPQRLHHRARAALRSRGLLQLIERHRVTHMHMVPTMFVRLLRLPEEVQTALRPVVAAFRRAWRGALPAGRQARHDRLVGTGHQRIFRLDRDRHPGVALGRGGAGEARHGRPRHRRRHRQDLPRRRQLVRCQRSSAKSIMRQTAVPDFDYHGKARHAPKPAATVSSASATSATSTRTAICSCATASATW